MRRAYLLTIATILAWSCGPVGSKALLRAQGEGGPPHPLLVACWAISCGWAFLAALLLARGRLGLLRSFSARGWAVLAAMGFFGWAGYSGSLNFAFSRLPLPDAIVINYLHPVFTVLFQGAAFGAVARAASGWEQAPERNRRPPAAALGLGLALCLLGVATVATGGRLSALSGAASPAGALAALFAALCWGVYSNLGRFVPVRPGASSAGLADVQTFAAMSFGLAMLVAALGAGGMLRLPGGLTTALHLGGGAPVGVSAWLIAPLVGLVLYCGGFTLWLAALEAGHRAGEAHRLPPLTYLTPALTVTWGWLVLREPFGAGFWQGALLIAIGNLMIVWRGRVRARGADGSPPYGTSARSHTTIR